MLVFGFVLRTPTGIQTLKRTTTRVAEWHTLRIRDGVCRRAAGGRRVRVVRRHHMADSKVRKNFSQPRGVSWVLDDGGELSGYAEKS